MLAGEGITMPVSDLFGRPGVKLLDGSSCRRRASIGWTPAQLIEVFETEIDPDRPDDPNRFHDDPGYAAVQTIPGVGPILGAVFVAEIGDVHPFPRAGAAGLVGRVDPEASRVGQAPCVGAGSPSRAPDWSAGPRSRRCNRLPGTPLNGAVPGPGRRETRIRHIGKVAAARELIGLVYYALRDHHVRRLDQPQRATA